MTFDKYRWAIPGQPIAKGRPRMAIKGHRIIAYTPDATRQYERDAKIIIKAAMAGRQALEGPVSVSMSFYFQELKRKKQWHTSRPDIDNLIKSGLDAMNGIAFVDDSQVCELHVFKSYGENPRVEIIMTGL